MPNMPPSHSYASVGYAEKYRHLQRPIHLIGIEFSRAERNLVAFEVETAAHS